MKVTLMNAVSLDGFISTLEGDSDWAVDDEVFQEVSKTHDCILIGRNTYEQYKGEIYPVGDVVNVVLTSSPEKFSEDQTNSLKFLGGAPSDVLGQLKASGFRSVMLAGGADTNGRFAQAGLIDNVILDVHPVLLGEGKPLLGGFTGGLQLKDSRAVKHEGFIQVAATVAQSK